MLYAKQFSLCFAFMVMMAEILWVASSMSRQKFWFPSFWSALHSLFKCQLDVPQFLLTDLIYSRRPQALHRVLAPSGPRRHSGVSALLQL